MADQITLRSHLIGSLTDLVESSNIGPFWKCSIVTELICLFADYEEEGAVLFLDAFLTDNFGELTKPIPQNTRLLLGLASCDETGIRKAVKRTAPLVRECWKMFLAVNDKSQLEYGLFRDSGHPLNIPLDIAMQMGESGTAKFIRLTKLAKGTVRVANHERKEAIIHFTNSKPVIFDGLNSIGKISELICSDLEPRLGQTCKTYIESLLSNALRKSHGALLGIVKKSRVPTFLSGCTSLLPPLSIGDAVESVKNDSNTIPQLHALESVLGGMFCCDGIVVFDTKANVIAYNGFVKLKASDVVGGARRRAYQALCEKIGKGLLAAYFQSQDGTSDFSEMSK